MTSTPVSAIFRESTSDAISPSMTPILNLFANAWMILRIIDVLPAPGEDMRFITKTRDWLNRFFRFSARTSLAFRMSSLTFKVLMAIPFSPLRNTRAPFCLFRYTDSRKRILVSHIFDVSAIIRQPVDVPHEVRSETYTIRLYFVAPLITLTQVRF